jgi:hypothetical protein
MTQEQKDILFLLGFADAREGKAYIAGPDSEAEREVAKGYAAGLKARKRSGAAADMTTLRQIVEAAARSGDSEDGA